MLSNMVKSVVAIAGLLIVQFGMAASAAAVPEISSNQPEYTLGDTAIIYGQYFTPGESVVMQVVRFDGSIVKGDGTNSPGADVVTVTDDGTFTYFYIVEGPASAYEGDIVANAMPLGAVDLTTGATLIDPNTGNPYLPLASTTFIDGTQYLLQGCSKNRGDCTYDGAASGWAGGTSPMSGWTAGNLKGWFEGDYVPYRLRIGLRDYSSSGTAVYVANEHDNLRSGVLGIDSATNFYVGAGPDGTVSPEGAQTKSCTDKTGLPPSDPSRWRLITDPPLSGCIVTGPNFTETDDDGDGFVDEEEVNGLDDDGDGRIDEDPERHSGSTSVKRIQYVWAVKFTSSETGGSSKKWALYWRAHLAAGSNNWPGSSIHAHTTKTGSSDVPISDCSGSSGSGANLSITKSDSPDPVFAGQDLTYTITVSNAGPNTATGVTVSDTLPAYVTFASATSTLGTCAMSGGIVTCSIGTLAVSPNPGSSATVTIVVTPLASAVGTLSNTAIVSSATSDPTPSNNTAGPITTTVNPSANLSIIKSASPNPVLAGQPLTYTITVGNAGPSTATGVTVNDTLPASVTLVSATSTQGSCTGTTAISCAIGTLANGASATVTIVVTPGASAVGTLSNTATVTSSVNDPNTSNNTSTTSSTVNPAANLSLTKSDSPDPVLAGQNLTYTILVTNNGPSAATGVTVNDTLPASVTLVSATSTQGSCTGTTAISCAIGTLANGASATVTIVVTPGASAVGTLSNTASVSGNEADVNTGNNSWTTTTTVDAAANLSITKTDSPDPVLVGQNLTYTIVVTNNGPNSATGVSMTDTLPAGATWVSTMTSQGSCSGTVTVTCNLGTLANAASATVTIVVTPTAGGTLSNTASVTGAEADPVSGNNSATTSTTVTGLSADLAANKTVSNGTVYVGQNLTYTITVTNLGPNSATGVTVSDTLPAGVSYVSATPSQGSCSGTTTVNCTLGVLGNGASATVTIVVTATASGTVTNTATVGSGVSDPNSSNNSASVSKTITAPIAQADMSITKSDAPDPVVVGGTLTYTMTVTNNGPNNATGVTVTDSLPAGVTFTSATPSQGTGCVGTSTVTCNLGAVNYPGSATVTLMVTVTPSAPSTITNPASVSSTSTDPVSGNNTASTTTTVLPPTLVTDLQVTQTVTPTPAEIGAQVTYTITVTNNGPDTATGVTLNNTLPPNATFNSVSTSQGTCGAPVSGAFTCSLGTITNGGSATITLIVTTTTLGSVGNTASVAGNESESTTINNTASASTNVGDLSRLINISTRGPVLTSPDLMYGGFILGGNLPKRLLIRGRGPSMSGAPFNISGTLANPRIDLYSGSTIIATNDNWQTTDPLCLSPATLCENATQITATNVHPCIPNPGQTVAPPGCANESALLVTLPPGPYSVVMSGVGNTTGIGLFGVIDLDTGTAPKLVNISTRGTVQASPNLMHGGFIIGAGTGPKTIVIRGRGPSMSGAPFNVPGTLANPQIDLYSAGVMIARNNNWQTSDPLCLSPLVACGTPAEITATGLDPCVPNPGQSVAPPGCTNEAALLVTLPPGPYNVVMSGVGNTSGAAIIGINEVSADLAITKSASTGSVSVGSPLTYTLTVSNNSSFPAPGVTVLDTLPAGVTLNSATSTQGTCTLGSTVTCSLGTVANGSPVTVTIVVTPTAAGTISNTASVSGTLNDPDTNNNITPAVTTTVNP
ncbi:MAG: DUF11 domain-containing protein [Nitrospirota bacterium]